MGVPTKLNRGRVAEFRPGWDCPGLPIEQKVETAPSGASFSEFKLSLGEEKAA